MFIGFGSEHSHLSRDSIRGYMYNFLDAFKDRKNVLAIPPDFTRLHSGSGELTEIVWDYFGQRLSRVLPSSGTHAPMSDQEIEVMYRSVPRALFQHHSWRTDLVSLGEVPASFVREQSEGCVDFSWPVQVS